jgi:uncharacterized membrane protein YraQ (UPF0718 family)
MAHTQDPETQTPIPSSSNEQTPLLSDPQPHEAEQQDEEVAEKKVRKASWYIWRIFWFIIAILILAAFIKGWIDAGGDVDVCFTPPQLSPRTLNHASSSI